MADIAKIEDHRGTKSALDRGVIGGDGDAAARKTDGLRKGGEKRVGQSVGLVLVIADNGVDAADVTVLADTAVQADEIIGPPGIGFFDGFPKGGGTVLSQNRFGRGTGELYLKTGIGLKKPRQGQAHTEGYIGFVNAVVIGTRFPRGMGGIAPLIDIHTDDRR